MENIFAAGGWLMFPLALCSVAVIAISVERFWTLNPNKIAPRNQLGDVWTQIQNNNMSSEQLKELRKSSPLGRVLAAGLTNSRHGREVMKDSIQEAASQVIHELERYLAILGTIAAVTPLLGLLGTVLGMIKVFAAIMLEGTGNAGVLAGGISQALLTTAAGLGVAIPAMISHRFFLRRLDALVITMEQDAVKLVDVLHNDRRVDLKQA
ncbi:biopolymer transport protein ExbB [Marinagarivorans cellulosilyticus]|uniref:Biopolymer transport protein ExbB n=2 Tax=Marinagarivorans cellulosilyticus TaxID=2721545 RepID=A0AAN1WL24_9GAMM|nr:MotA/TolQ/ExbB proton channel family protein [Marinagarivorans cellulosilyticus]BCD99550.1 biopolymer transport protein ExbB [Marinagarivorans cellulosilyticus]